MSHSTPFGAPGPQVVYTTRIRLDIYDDEHAIKLEVRNAGDMPLEKVHEAGRLAFHAIHGVNPKGVVQDVQAHEATFLGEPMWQIGDPE